MVLEKRYCDSVTADVAASVAANVVANGCRSGDWRRRSSVLDVRAFCIRYYCNI